MKMSASIDIRFGMTKAELMRAIMDIPDQSTISVYTSKGDRPWESDSHEIKFTWTKGER